MARLAHHDHVVAVGDVVALEQHAHAGPFTDDLEGLAGVELVMGWQPES